MIENKYIVLTAQIISMLFSPFHMPVIAFVFLLFFSYMSFTPLIYKVFVLFMVYVFTIFLPRVSIFFYRKINGWTRHHLGRRANRFVPYLISIVNYAVLLYLMNSIHMPRYTLGIISGALSIQLICTALNYKVKVSTHAAAAGGVLGALVAFAFIFNFNPTYWFCFCCFICGLVCSSRLILRQHTLTEVGLGALVGVVCGYVFIII